MFKEAISYIANELETRKKPLFQLTSKTGVVLKFKRHTLMKK